MKKLFRRHMRALARWVFAKDIGVFEMWRNNLHMSIEHAVDAIKHAQATQDRASEESLLKSAAHTRGMLDMCERIIEWLKK